MRGSLFTRKHGSYVRIWPEKLYPVHECSCLKPIMKWLQSPENQAKRDSDISWDSHGKKNAERACSPLSRCLVGESCFLFPWDRPSHPSFALCQAKFGSDPSLPAVQTHQVCKDSDDSLKFNRCHGNCSLGSSHRCKCSHRSQQVAGLFFGPQTVSGSCGSGEPIQTLQFHECYGWHSCLPHSRINPLSCSLIHSSPWLAFPHRSSLLVVHSVPSLAGLYSVEDDLDLNMLSFGRLLGAPLRQSFHNMGWDCSWA